MEEFLKQQIKKELISSNVARTWSETQSVSEEVTVSDEQRNNDDNIGISSEGVRYYKSLVSKYLNDNGYPFTQENVDMVAKMFSANNDGYVKSTVETVKKSDLDALEGDQLDIYIKSKIASILSQFRQDFQMHQFMTYEIDIVSDKPGGATDVEGLKRSLRWRSERGWRLKNVFTNEVGKNSSSVSVGSLTSGINSTIDQVILIYERPVTLTDEKAKRILSEL